MQYLGHECSSIIYENTLKEHDHIWKGIPKPAVLSGMSTYQNVCIDWTIYGSLKINTSDMVLNSIDCDIGDGQIKKARIIK